MTASNTSPHSSGPAAGRPRLAPLLAMPLLLLLGGCLWGGAERSMELTIAESVAEPPAEAGPIQLVGKTGTASGPR